jgi:hypothetical protein
MEEALKSPMKGSTSSTVLFMTPTKNCYTSTESPSRMKLKSLSLSTSPKSYCTSTENARSSKKRESQLLTTPTKRKQTLGASPLTPKGQVRARFPKARRLESQRNPSCSVPPVSETKPPFFMPEKSESYLFTTPTTRKLSFSTSPKNYCTSTGNAHSSKKRESKLLTTPTRKHKLGLSPLTPKGQVRARFPKARLLESQRNPSCSVPPVSATKSPFFMPVKTITDGFDQSGERTRVRIRALPPILSHALRPVEIDGNSLCLLPISESVLVTPQVQGGPKRPLPFLNFMSKESIHETRPPSLKRLASRRRSSLLFQD